MSKPVRRRFRRTLASAMLGLILALSLWPGLSYSRQNREFATAAPSARFPLGTDELGRDRLTRLLFATRISLLLSAVARRWRYCWHFWLAGSRGMPADGATAASCARWI